MLVHVKAFGSYDILGESVDDAVGEAFDKTAKLLGLPYPGGPSVAKLALQGDAQRFTFTRPMINRPGCDFSFSGLKTAVANTVQKHGDDPQTKADVAASFQEAAIDTLVRKCRRALEQTNLKQLAIVGGVSANVCLRERCQSVFAKQGVDVFYPRHEYCTDNGAMVAYTGLLRLSKGVSEPLSLSLKARWSMMDID